MLVCTGDLYSGACAALHILASAGGRAGKLTQGMLTSDCDKGSDDGLMGYRW
jgi:hypothetical protein